MQEFIEDKHETLHVLSPVLATQNDDNQAISCDAQSEDKGVDYGQEDPLKVSGHPMLPVARLLQFHPQFTRTRTRARTRIIEVIVKDDVLETHT